MKCVFLHVIGLLGGLPTARHYTFITGMSFYQKHGHHPKMVPWTLINNLLNKQFRIQNKYNMPFSAGDTAFVFTAILYNK